MNFESLKKKVLLDKKVRQIYEVRRNEFEVGQSLQKADLVLAPSALSYLYAKN